MPTAATTPPLNNRHIGSQTRLLSPKELLAAHPLNEAARATVVQGRHSVESILERREPRVLLVVGPCSIHDPAAALDYARRLKALTDELQDVFCIVMRVYFEKPRTSVGWKGLINDPDLNGSFDIEKGLHIARQLLLDINALGLPVGTEALDPISPQYIGDLVSWTAIGARTTESQTHREMSSGLSTAVGFKNGTDGSLEVAINAIESASRPHSFLGIDASGMTAITRSTGNPYGHVVLRGGHRGPNYDSVSIALCEQALRARGLTPSLVVDCSHANSSKDPQRQPLVFQNVIEQIAHGNQSIIGLMLESHLQGGSQPLGDDPAKLTYGQSITDGCIDWPTTEALLRQSAHTLRQARAAQRSASANANAAPAGSAA
ncbi:3-deoxy-7-phosphoheptulonate synthase [Vandammella animalimorsus]|uniref:3-deoxy-7-phosphoheptulonate synthase n=1 Tax=Vandammella animalimorsus TaxID=2029117 RepID=UPI0031BB7F29